MGKQQRALAMVVELAPFALTPSGLYAAVLAPSGHAPRSAPGGEFTLLARGFDTAEFEHPLATAQATARALFTSGDWEREAAFYVTGFRYGAGTGSRPHELVFTVAAAMNFDVPFRQYRDHRSPDLAPVWVPWRVDSEGDAVIEDLAKPAYDPRTARIVATHAITTLRREIYDRPERIAALFENATDAQAETSLQNFYGRGSLTKQEIRKLLAHSQGRITTRAA